MSATARPTRILGSVQAALLWLVLVVFAATVIGELTRGVLVGSATFLFHRFIVVRELICRHHRVGVLATRDGEHERALASFRQSEDFFNRNRWLDEGRGFFLASASRWPFRVQALYNQAWIHWRLGQHEEAEELLDRLEATEGKISMATALRGQMRRDAEHTEATWGDVLAETG